MASGVHDDPSDVDSPSSNKESSGDSVVTQATAPPSVMATAAAPKLDAPFKAAPFWSLYRYADRWDWLWMIFGFIGAIANGIMMPLFTIVFGDVLNSFGLNLFDPTALAASVNQQVPRFVYLGIGAFFASFIQTFFLVYPSVRQANRMRGTYLRTVLGQDAGFFDTDGTAGYLLQGLNEDCATVQAAIGEKVSMFAFMMATAIAGIVIAFTRGWDMSLVLMSLLPVLAITGFAVSVLVARLTVAMNRAYADANSLAQEALSNVRTVYAFNGQERTVTDYDAALIDPMKVGIKQGLYGGFTTGMANCVAYLGYSLAMWYGAKRVAAGAYTGGEVLNVLFAALIGGFALGQAVPNWQGFQSGSVSGGRLFSIMGRKPEIDAEAPGQEPKEVQGTVELRNVVFAYPSRLDKPVFNGFNLIVPAGKTVALVGESGSGKSTVVSLIERFYDPQSGAVLLDGVDIRHLRLRWLRAQLGLVSQEPTLFGTTIKENILYGRPGASEEDVEAAARAANAATFISHLPLGYDTHVGEKGVQMSGGQKQRIAIARAILRNPAVLLLDEATSALDAESEHVVQDALDRLMVGRTTVVVAHRLSTVRDADCIAVVKQGAVVEQGTHDELIERAGVYATLVHMQYSDRRESLLGYEISNETHEGELGSLERLVSGIGRALMGTTQGREAGKSHLPVSVPVPRTSSTTLDLTEAGAVSHVKEQKEKGAEEEEITPVESEKGDESAPQLAGPPSRSRWLRWRGAKKKQKKANATSEEDGEKKRDEEEEGSEVPLGRLAALNRPETPALLGGLVGSIAMGMLMPAFSFAFSSLIGVFYLSLPSEIQSGARKWSLAFVGIGFGALIAAVIQSYCFNFMGQHLGKRVRVLMMRALLRQEIGWYDDEHNSSGVLTSKLSSDALAVKGQFGDTMALLTQNLVTLIAGYIIAGVYSWRMMLVVTATMPVMIAAVMIQSKLIIDYVSGERETFAAANATAAEAFSSARTVMAFGMEDQVTKLYDKQLEAPTRAARGRIVSAGVGFGFTQFSIFGIFSLAFWYAGVEVSNGTSSFTDVLKAFFAIFMAAFAASQSQLHFPDVAKGRAAAKRVFAVIDRTPAIDDSPSKGTRPTECRGEVELRDICFSYPQRQDAIVFENFNLTVPAGRTIALVGESGSGKSTIVSLIERFYDPQSGAVLLDGVDIRTLNLHWLRSQIGLVSQEPVLFNLTVADNIRYGRPLATLEEVVAAGKAANAHTFIEALPEGYHTKLGEGGIQLSGGQKQRVAIARAVVKDPRILLLDEATSALDAESERVVQEALDNLMKGRTTVVVAHRLSTVRDADSIAVVYKGRIVEQGTHTELIDKNGAYARLVAHQMRHHAL